MSLTKQEREEAAQVKKEEARLKKQPFKTMVEPSPEVVEELRGWKEPRKAYVLMEMRKYDLNNDRWYRGLATLDVDGRPEREEAIRYYINNKAGKILHYANFPSFDSPIQEHVAKARLYGGQKQRNVWGELARFCDREMQKKDVSIDEFNAMKRKIQELEARDEQQKIRESDAPTGSKNGAGRAKTDRRAEGVPSGEAGV